MRDALKNYLALANGLTEVGRQRAVAASKALVAQGEATAEQVSSLAEDLISSSKQNRAVITSVVRSEIEKAMNRLGLATADEVARLTRRLQSVEVSLRDAAASPPAASPAAKKPAAKKPAAKRTATKKAPARKVTAAKKPAVKKAPVKKAPVKRAPVKKATARRATP